MAVEQLRKPDAPLMPANKRAARVTFWRQRELYLMCLLPVIFLVVFSYGPMGGLVIAFKDYSIRKGIWASDWVGFKYFEQFLSTPLFKQLLTNTMLLSLYSLVIGFIMPIVLAFALNEVRSRFFVKTVQMATYFPYFISTVVMVGILLQFLSPQGGFVNNLIKLTGRPPLQFMSVPSWWRHIYVWSGVWQGTGYSAILYIAALSGVDQAVVESAIIDGVSRFKRVIHIDIPAILPTVVILLILGVGGVMNLGAEKVYLMQNDLNGDVSEIIATFVLKRGIGKAQHSYATAVGLFNSIVNFILIFLANQIARRIGETSLW